MEIPLDTTLVYLKESISLLRESDKSWPKFQGSAKFPLFGLLFVKFFSLRLGLVQGEVLHTGRRKGNNTYSIKIHSLLYYEIVGKLIMTEGESHRDKEPLRFSQGWDTRKPYFFVLLLRDTDTGQSFNLGLSAHQAHRRGAL